MTEVRLDNGKLVIRSLENRGDSIIRQETVYTRKMSNKIREVFKKEEYDNQRKEKKMWWEEETRSC